MNQNRKNTTIVQKTKIRHRTQLKKMTVKKEQS